MSDLEDRVCWNVHTAISTLSTEAVSPSTPVFLATHAPLRMRRRDPQLRDEVTGVPVTEEDILHDFLNRQPGNGALLMPVIGESGTGKSHLVRWVYERTRRHRPDNQVIIHIPKASTSLRALIRILLQRDDIQSEKLIQLRNQVDDLASGMDEEALQRHLLFALAEAVSVADPGTDMNRRTLVGPGKLAEVLRDVTVREHLTQPGALIPRLAASLLNDRGDGESDRPTTFLPEDLPHIVDVTRAAERVRKLLTVMMSRAPLQKAAAELITENLSTAVQQVFKLGGRLQDAMLTIREEYEKQGKEIVLLIEDFAVIQGLQRDLLDALIEAGVRDGRQVYAPVRTLMAITSGYYRDLAKTVVTRMEAATPYVYDLDADFEQDGEGQERTMDFVGRYLNAARVGADRLEVAGVGDNAEAPNACDGCQFQTSCHEAFGVSRSGHGLFPLNWAALRRAIRSTPGRDEGDTFNPRRIIGRVIRPVLEDAESLAAGQFPDNRFREQFPLARTENALLPTVKVRIEELDPANSDRFALLLEFWGDAPSEVTNLHPEIHKAFAIAPLRVAPSTSVRTRAPIGQPVITTSPRAGSAKSGATPRTSLSDPREAWPRSLRENLDSILDWEAGHRSLSQNAASAIRGIVSEAVFSRCDWSVPLMAEPSSEVKRSAWPPKSSVVSIKDAEAEAQSAGAPILFHRNPQNAVFFSRLLTLQAKVDDPGNEAALPRLARLAELHQPDLVGAVLRQRGGDDEHLTAGLTVSLLGASLAGRAWPGMKDAELLAAAFDNGASWTLGDAALRTPGWNDALNKHLIVRPALVSELRQLLGARQGTGGSDARILDTARALPLVRRAAQDWAWKAIPTAPKAFVNANSPVRSFDRLVEQQHSTLREFHGRLSQWLPVGVGLKETLDAVGQAFEEAAKVGLLPGGDFRQAFPVRLRAMRSRSGQIVEQLRRDLDQIESAEDSQWRQISVTAAVRDRGADLELLMRFLSDCDEWLSQGLAAAALHTGGLGEDLAKQVRDVLAEWEQIAGVEPAQEGSDE